MRLNLISYINELFLSSICTKFCQMKVLKLGLLSILFLNRLNQPSFRCNSIIKRRVRIRLLDAQLYPAKIAIASRNLYITYKLFLGGSYYVFQNTCLRYLHFSSKYCQRFIFCLFISCREQSFIAHNTKNAGSNYRYQDSLNLGNDIFIKTSKTLTKKNIEARRHKRTQKLLTRKELMYVCIS